MKKTLKRLVLAAIVVLLAVLVFRTVRLREPDASSVAEIPIDGSVDVDAAVRRLAEAIRIPTISNEDRADVDVAAFEGFRDFLATSYPLVHQELDVELFPGGSLLYRWEGHSPEEKPVVLLAHFDVVPVPPDELEAWTHPPFSGTVDQGYVWGRGALDDKGSAIAIMEAVESLLQDGFKPSRTVYVALGHDEELDGMGARAIAASLGRREPHGVELVLDEGGFVTSGAVPGVTRPVAVVGVAEKGYLTLRLRVEGSPGHSSAPSYPTTIGRLSRAIYRLEANPLPTRIDGAAELMFLRLGSSMDFFQRIIFANLWLFEPVLTNVIEGEPQLAAMTRTTLSPTIIHGGLKDNVLPSHATATVNFRLLPGDTSATIIEWARRTIDDDQVRVESVAESVFEASPVSSPESGAFRLVKSTLGALAPLREKNTLITPYLVLGATDSRHYQDLTKNVLRFAPFSVKSEELAGLHGIDERLGVDSLHVGITFYKEMLKRLDQL